MQFTEHTKKQKTDNTILHSELVEVYYLYYILHNLNIAIVGI